MVNRSPETPQAFIPNANLMFSEVIGTSIAECYRGVFPSGPQFDEIPGWSNSKEWYERKALMDAGIVPSVVDVDTFQRILPTNP